MKDRHAMLVALAVAVTLASVAAAGPGATRQRVAITATILPSAKGVLAPVTNGALVRDAGTFDGDWQSRFPGRTLVRDGQSVTRYTGVWTFTGKRGTIVFRERNDWVDLGQDGNRDGQEDGVAIGTWKVVRGTGEYAGIAGGGRSGHAGLGRKWYARYEGFVTVARQ